MISIQSIKVCVAFTGNSFCHWPFTVANNWLLALELQKENAIRFGLWVATRYASLFSINTFILFCLSKCRNRMHTEWMSVRLYLVGMSGWGRDGASCNGFSQILRFIRLLWIGDSVTSQSKAESSQMNWLRLNWCHQGSPWTVQHFQT